MKLLKLQNDAQKRTKCAKTMAKKLACSAVLAGILATNASAIGIGSFKINPDFGVSLGGNSHKHSLLDNAFLAGGYARLWMGGKGLTIAPMVKYNYIFGKNGANGFGNLQAGGLIGYSILRLTPYVGGSYSRFDKIGYEDTAAINYGIYFDIPVVPLSVGLDVSSQNPKIVGSNSRSGWQHQIALTLGLIF